MVLCTPFSLAIQHSLRDSHSLIVLASHHRQWNSATPFLLVIGSSVYCAFKAVLYLKLHLWWTSHLWQVPVELCWPFLLVIQRPECEGGGLNTQNKRSHFAISCCHAHNSALHCIFTTRLQQTQFSEYKNLIDTKYIMLVSSKKQAHNHIKFTNIAQFKCITSGAMILLWVCSSVQMKKKKVT